ncbi:tRNA uridine-5-carboxymethylaminomethyl(34) synthesis enzyme MnmG, partial [Vibrio cholerae]|nr:tRNA uridine-5-carboxymethylaminomethyl(34) synthesis enzyme MnmG [Vibrio cholerae]
EKAAKERQRLQGAGMNANSVGVGQLRTLLKTPRSREAGGEDLLRRPEMTYGRLSTLRASAPALADAEAAEPVEIQVKYDGYI